MKIDVNSKESLNQLLIKNNQEISLLSLAKEEVKGTLLSFDVVCHFYENGSFEDELRKLGVNAEDISLLGDDLAFYYAIIDDEMLKLTIDSVRNKIINEINEINMVLESRFDKAREHNKKIDDEIQSIMMINSFIENVIFLYDDKGKVDIDKLYDLIESLPLELEDVVGITESITSMIMRRGEKGQKQGINLEKFNDTIIKKEEKEEKRISKNLSDEFEKAVSDIRKCFAKELQDNIRYIPGTNLSLEEIDINDLSRPETISIYVSSLIDMVNGSDGDLKEGAKLLLEKIKEMFSSSYQNNLREELKDKIILIKKIEEEYQLDSTIANLSDIKAKVLVKMRELLRRGKDYDLNELQEMISSISIIVGLTDEATDLINYYIKEEFQGISELLATYVSREYLSAMDLSVVKGKVDYAIRQIEEYKKELDILYKKINSYDILNMIKEDNSHNELTEIKAFLLFDGHFVSGEFVPYVVSDLEVRGKNTLIDENAIIMDQSSYAIELRKLLNDFLGGIIENGYSNYLLATQGISTRGKAIDNVYYGFKKSPHDGKKMDVYKLKNSASGMGKITEKMYRVNENSYLHDVLCDLFLEYGAKVSSEFNLYAVFATGIEKMDTHICDETVRRCGTGTSGQKEGYLSYLYMLLSNIFASELNNMTTSQFNNLPDEKKKYLNGLVNELKDMVHASFKAYDEIQAINSDKVLPEDVRCDVIEKMKKGRKVVSL